MKKILLLTAFLFASSLALAEGKPQPVGDPTQLQGQIALGGAGGKSTAVSGAAAGAISSSGSNSHSSNSMGDITVTGSGAGTHDEGSTYVAPAPVFTMVPQSNNGIVTNSYAVGIGWNLFSWSRSNQTIAPDIVAGEMISEYERLCQYETASMLRQRRYALVDPSYRELPKQPGVVNMTREQCAAQRR